MDPIEGPGPAWILDAAGQESLPLFAYTPSRHVAAARGTASQNSQAISADTPTGGKLQNSLSAQPDASWQGQTSGSASISASAAQTLTGFSSSPSTLVEGKGQRQGEAAPGSPEGAAADAGWHGFAAHAGSHAADIPKSAFPGEGSVTGAADVAQHEAAQAGSGEQSSLGGSIAAFSGFDVPEDNLPQEPVAQAQDSTVSVPPVTPHQASQSATAICKPPSETEGSAAARPVIPAKTETKAGANQLAPAKVERRISGAPKTPAKTYRSSSAVFSRGPAGDEASGNGLAGGADRVSGAGPGHKDSQLPRRRSATNGVSGAKPVSASPSLASHNSKVHNSGFICVSSRKCHGALARNNAVVEQPPVVLGAYRMMQVCTTRKVLAILAGVHVWCAQLHRLFF